MYYVDVCVKNTNGEEISFEPERIMNDEFVGCVLRHFKFYSLEVGGFLSEITLKPQEVFEEYMRFNSSYKEDEYHIRHTANLFKNIMRGISSKDDTVVLSLC